MKAMILAAGEGRRMRPLTEHTPKPLLHVGELRLIEHHILRLKKAGIDELVINVSYLGQQIIDTLGDGQNYGVSIQYSVEQMPLETGGALYQALPLLLQHVDFSPSEAGQLLANETQSLMLERAEPFILVNGDVWTDIDFSILVNMNLSDDHDACLMLVGNPEHNPGGDFQLGNFLTDESSYTNVNGDCKNSVCYLQNCESHSFSSSSYTFSGVSLVHPRMIASYPHRRDKFPLKEVFELAISQRKLLGFYYAGEWMDIGTPERLNRLRQRFASISTPRAY